MKKANRYISLLLCISLLLSISITSIQAVWAAEKSVEILLDGKVTDHVAIDQVDKVTLSAVTENIADPAYQWQILYDVEDSVWVNIYDRTEQNCEISYALVKNMLDGANSTYIRCAVTTVEETVYSGEVSIVVNPEPTFTPQVTAFAQTRYVANETAYAADTPATFAVARDSDEEYVTITIKYLDISSLGGAEEAAVYSPYIATIEKGTEFRQSVVSPTFLGFAPYIDSDDNGVIDAGDASAATYVFNETSVNEDIVIKVYYKPIEVNFAIKYFFQNINDDHYTEDAARYHTGKAETGSIISNDYLIEHAGQTTGFTKMYHIPESVAADGSTVFECYYDRNYYLIQFDLNGGYGVDPIYARYNTPFIVNDPIRHGYTFAGWKLVGIDENGESKPVVPGGAADEMVSTIPPYNYYYQAQWETIDTTYNVVYWLDNKYIGSKSLSARSGTYVSGKDDLTGIGISDTDKKYCVYDKADENVLVEGDGSTVVNVYYKSKEYTLRFYYAATEGEGTDTDGDGVADTYDTVKIIGGSTYQFGKTGTDTTDDEVLLRGVFGTQAGEIVKFPQLNETGKSRDYKRGTLVSTDGKTTYHYIEFTASYGQDISNLWPCSVFEPATRKTANSQSNWSGMQAIVSAWNGEHHVYYSQENKNQTIKGNYEKLDYQLLFHPKYDDEDTVSYLCFWENGADIGWSVPKLFVYKIWVPVLNGENTQSLVTKVKDGITYKLIDSYDTCDNSTVNEQTKPALQGYTCNTFDSETVAVDNAVYKEGYIVNFYYKQERYTFSLKNHNNYLVNIEKSDTVADSGVPFGTNISSLDDVKAALNADYTPPYPTTLEENAYDFEGWYTTELCLPGTEIDLSLAEMPANGLILHANWVPKTHTARFFTTYDDLLAFENNTSSRVHYSADVKHGEIVGTVETPVQSAGEALDLTFAGWFYIENGQKKAFSPLNMPVNSDMNIFAEWSSHSPQPYRVSYVLQSDPDIKVADDTTGFAYGGSTRTFSAKAGNPMNQLYPQYNQSYFPTVSSHSITIQAEADKENPQQNVYTFYYVQAQNITYTVRYVNKETNTVMETQTHTTTSAVVTERFKAFADMVPDAFYKRLVLEVEDNGNGEWVGTENNVITFYYTPNKTNAYYAVHFMLEKADATDEQRNNYDINGNGGYEETGTHIEGVGKIRSTVYIAPQEIPGFSLINNTTVPIVLSGGAQSNATYSKDNGGYGITVTQSGTELYLFYKRNDYPYQVHYYEYNTTSALSPSETFRAPFGSQVKVDSKPIPGYTCVSERTQTITIREDDGTKGLNVIIFYYAPVQYVAEYVPVPNDGGWLSNTIEVISGSDNLAGSVPNANPYYEFGGWYLDEDCTKPVTNEFGTVDTDNRFIPEKTKLSETARNIFYAKFVKKVGDFTIDRNGAADDDQVFVYEIKNTDTGAVYHVTVTGNGSATIHNLPLGEYTVTQQNNWSWRYDDQVLSGIIHQDANGTTVVFAKAEQKTQWLNGNSKIKKNQRGKQYE